MSGTLTTGTLKNGLYGVVKTTNSNVANAIAAGPYGLNGLADGVEKLTLLDGNEITVPSDTLVIADDKQAIAFIKQHSWPGNVRELKTTLTRASIWCDDEVIEPLHIEQSIIARHANKSSGGFGTIGAGFSIETEVNKLKQHYIEQALTKTKYKKGQAVL